MTKRNFEVLDHTVYGGETLRVPFYLDSQEGLNDDSVALLHAADIIGGNPDTYEGDLNNLLEEVGILLEVKNKDSGIIIEDDHGAGSISVGYSETEVIIQRINQSYKIPTILLFDMLYAWVNDEQFGQGGETNLHDGA